MDHENRAIRRQYKRVARVISEDGNLICSCIIINISTSGALLLYDRKSPPDAFQLFEVGARILREVRVARRLPISVAVRFVGEPQIIGEFDYRARAWK